MYEYLGENWSASFYAMSLSDDSFVHFTPLSRAKKILLDNRLKKNPPYRKFGIDAVTAVSTSFGGIVSGVQTTHIQSSKDDPIVALWFKTNTLPQKVNYVEEVYWAEDVVFTKVKLLTKSKAESLLKRSTPPQVPSGDEYAVVYHGSRSHKELKSRLSKSAKYQNKKTLENKGGDETTVYEYSDQQITKRHKEKSKKVEKTRQKMSELEQQVLKDLKGTETQQVALAVALINHTYERVGNDESASNGHYGVTGWKKKHLSFKDGKAFLSYTGKSGVRHNKEVEDTTLVSALRKRSEGLSPEDTLLDEISASDVNSYLGAFGITAKDIRGYHANREMQERLKALRKENGELPKDKKKRDHILKDEFKEALKGAAKAVGHEEATLRKQYLVPHLEDTYMKDGTVITTLKKARVTRIATRVFGTKSESEQIDAEAERLIRKQPKNKPPRKDKQRRRMELEDKDTTKDTDLNSKDMSMNHKVIGALVASRYLLRVRVATRFLVADEKEKKNSLLRRKESEAWEGFKKEKIKDPETKREVTWGTYEKKHPEDAKKIRKNFRSDFSEKFDSDQTERQNEQARSLDKKLTEEDLEGFDSGTEEVVSLNGREVRVPLDASDSVRGVVNALGEGKKDDESVEEYTERKKAEVITAVKSMNTEELQQMWDSGVIDKSDPRVEGAIDTMMSLPAMTDVVGRPLSEAEATDIEAFYSAMLTKTIEVEHFSSSKDEGKSFLADFIEGAKDNAVSALQQGGEPDLNQVMTDYMKGVNTKMERKQTKIRDMTKEFLSPEQKESIKNLEKVQAEVSERRSETQSNMDRLFDLKSQMAVSDPSQDDLEELGWDIQQLENQLGEDKENLQKSLDSFNTLKSETEPTPEALQKTLGKMIKSLPKDKQKEIKNQMKEEGFDPIGKIMELSKVEATEKYLEIIKNSANMTPEEKASAIERASDPSFDPEGALLGMMSQSGNTEEEAP